MRSVPWWGLLSSSAAPVLLIGGWTLSAALQPAGFDPLVESISELAAADAANREVMSLALFGVGICHLVTAIALRPVPIPARALLAIGGMATIGVAALPLPSGVADSLPHATAATVALVAIAAWPALAGRHSMPVLRPQLCVGVAAVLLLLVGWFFVSVVTEAPLSGLSERIAAGAQSAWPFAVVAALRHTSRTAAAAGS